MIALLALHLVLGLVGLTWGRRLGRTGLLVGVIGPVASTVWLGWRLPGIVDGDVLAETVSWMPALGVDLDLRLDGFAALMVLLVSGIGVAVYAYAYRYFSPGADGLGRLAGMLTLFSGSMYGLVVADDLLVLYGFWELTSITSFLLIGNDHRNGRARAAALQALLVTSTGALAMLVGFVLLGQAAGTYRLSAILSDPPSGNSVSVALALIALGAFTKSAQYPFHSWLPGAMVAPTPVSAYLHSATMVKAGVYLLARLSPAFAEVGFWRPLVVVVGLTTMIGGGLRALHQTDLKLLLAMGTVSQLGFMTAVFGLGSTEAVVAGSAVLLAHGLFKAAAFMVVGILDHQHGTRDLRRLPRPEAGWQLTAAVTMVAAASMAGVPLALGFVAKEAVFEAFVHERGGGWGVAVAAAVAGSVLTVAYSWRFTMGALGRLATPGTVPQHGDVTDPPRVSFVIPGCVLAGATALFGVAPGLLDGVVGAAASSLDPGVDGVHLALWHGLNGPLALSAVALGCGTALFAFRGRIDPLIARFRAESGSSSHVYRRSLRGLNAIANRTARIVQSGSLPTYLAVIILTAAVVPGGLLLTGDAWPGWPDLVDGWVQVPAAAVIIGAALAASIVHRRFTAALFLGVVGYAMAGLFVLHGAPDLALTQVGIETLTTVLFVLVLRRLPDRYETRTPLLRKTLRLAVAGVVGTTVFVLALVTGAQDPETIASDVYIDRAVPDGGGKNVVNVILVDFRGFDTLGEITVLAIAAIGTVALARAGRRPAPETATSAVAAVPPPVRVARLVTLEVSMRVVFTVVMVGSLYLLFAGHNQPGGGFAGGIVAGAAVALRYISGGIGEVRKLSRGQPWLVLGAGVVVAALTALGPLLFGGSVLEGSWWETDVPLLGHVKVTTALAFDIGVYLVVVGLALMVFESFGDDPPPGDDVLPVPVPVSSRPVAVAVAVASEVPS